MSAVLAAFANTPAAPLPWRPGGEVALRALHAIDLELAATPLADARDAGGEALDAGADPETLLLVQCADEIAAEAGAGATVHAIGANRQRTLLSAAVAALPSRAGCRGAARSIVYLPQRALAALGADALLATLCRLAAQHGEDALLVVAVETTPGRSVSCLDRLARVAGWELCQLWSDGFARHALHVLERSARAALLRAS